MKKCIKCKKLIPSKIKIDGKTRRTSRSRKMCYDCSPHKTRRTTSDKNIGPVKCRVCGKIKSPSEFSGRRYVCKKCRTAYVVERRRKVKRRAVEYLGNKCSKCGNSYPDSVYDFHHIDPSRKEETLSYLLRCGKWENIKKELKKCILVCANCHRIIHNNQ